MGDWGTGSLFYGLLHVSFAFMTFHGESRVDHHVAEHIHESPKNMTLPLTILAILSFFGGFLGIPGASAISNFLSPVFGEHGHTEISGQKP